MNLEEIKKNISNYSNEKLIIEGIINKNDYRTEVLDLLNQEIGKRNIQKTDIDLVVNKRNEEKNHQIKKRNRKLRGFLLFIAIILFIDFLLYFLAGIVAINNLDFMNLDLISIFLIFFVAISCLLSFIMILCKKKFAKKMIIVLLGVCILSSIINVIVQIISNDISIIGKDLFLILKDSLFIMYFIKSDYVKNYLVK